MQPEPAPTDLMNAIVDLSNATADGLSALKTEFKHDFGELGQRFVRTETDLMNAIVDLSNATASGLSRAERALRSEMREGFHRVEGRLTSIEGEVGGIRHWSRTDGRIDALERRRKH